MNNDRRRNEAWVTPIGVGTIGAGQAAHRCRAIAIRCWNEALAMFEGFQCRAFTKAAMIKELLTSNTKSVAGFFIYEACACFTLKPLGAITIIRRWNDA